MKKGYKNFMGSGLKKAILSFGLLTALGVSKSNAQVSLTATAGTATGTFTTVSDAFAAINAGTHKGAIVISITNSTTEPAAPTPLYGSGTASASSSSYTSVMIKPSGGSFTINSALTPSNYRGVIELAGADNVTIDGDPLSTGTRNLTIQVATTTNTYTSAVRISSNSTSGTDGATNIAVKNCNLIGARPTSVATTISYGINFSNYSTTSATTGAYSNSNIAIVNNVIKRAHYGIYAYGASTTYPNNSYRIANNFIGSSTPSDNIGAYGIYLYYNQPTTNPATNFVIEGNDIQAGDYTTGYSASVYGIYASTYNYGLIIRRNNIHDIAQSSTSGYGAFGIYCGSSLNNDWTIENNFIRDMTANSYATVSTYPSSYQNYGIFLSSIGTGFKINNNTIYLNKANATTLTTANPMSACLAFYTTTAISQLYNNIFINNQGGVSTAAMCIYTYGTANLPVGSTNNNNYYCPSSGKIGYYSSALISTLSAWQSTTGLDPFSISENVAFTSTTDLHVPTGTSTLCESGGATTATTGAVVDIDSQARPGISTYGFGTAPDIGADEFNGQVVYTCTTPTPGATIASPSTICLGQTVNFSFATSTPGTGVVYQWQSSPDNITYTDITAATSTAYSTVPTAALYYRCKVTCKNGPIVSYSTPVLVTFTNNISSTTNAIRCGTGTVNLLASGTTGTTLRWYAAATGGAALGIGSPFTTPSIASTTTYYVGAETISSGIGTIGTGTSLTTSSGYPTAYGNFWYQDWQQIVYTAAELQAAGLTAGNITALAMNISGLPGPASVSGYSIKIATTAASTLSTFTTTGLTNVFGPSTVTPASGWNTITFSTPFYWDGISNILVDIRGDGAYGSANATTYYTPTTGTTCLYAYTSTSSPGTYYTSSPTPTASTSRPNIRFSGSVVCSSPRIPVTATVNTPPPFTITGTQTVCNNAPAMMSVTSTLASFNTYVWTPATGLFTDAACTTPYVAGSSASTVYAKTTSAGAVTYTCTANNTSTLCANTASVIVTTLPSVVTAVATPPNVCGSGSTTLAISPAVSTFGAGTWQWQSSADNITFADSTGMTGATLTTPTLTLRRYYRITLKNGLGAVCLNSTSDTALVLIPAISSVTPAARCGTGTVVLGANGVDGIVNWYAAATGGTSLATGPSYTTPSLTSTTTYYVSSEASPDVNAAIGTGTVTNGTTGYPTPFGNWYGGSHDQYLITAAELTAAGYSAGTLTSIAFDQATTYTGTALSNYQVKMAATALGNLSGGLVTTGFTTVIPSSTYVPSSSTGYTAMPFTTNFYWDGISNIVVDVSFINCSSCVVGSCTTSFTYNGSVNQTSTSYVSARSIYADGDCTVNTMTPTSSGSTYSQRPNMKFYQLGCKTSTRTPVTATINTIPTVTVTAATPIMCVGFITSLTASATPSAIAATTTYTWAPTAGLYSDAACTIPYTGAVTSVVYYKSTAAGSVTYTATGTNSVGNCVNSGSATITINPTPTVAITPVGSTTVCADSGVMMRSTYTGTGLTFQWFNGTTAVTGATNDSLFANAISGAGNYTLKVSLGSCSATSNISTLVLNPLPTPLITPAGKLNVCSDVTTVLTGSGAGTYQWFNTAGPITGATGTTYTASTVTGPSYYALQLINPVTGCRKMTPFDTVIVTPKPTVSITPVASTAICADSFQVLTSVHSSGYGTGNTYQWYNGTTPVRTNDTLWVNAIPGVYTLKVTNNGLCSTTSNPSTIVVNPLPAASFTKTGPNNAICVGGTRELTALTIPASSNYQWMLNGVVIPGATSQIYNAPVAGIYSVRITDFNNCRKFSDTMSLFMSPLGIPNLSPKDLRFCQGTTITLYSNADPSAISYLWTRNGVTITDTTRNINTGLSGTYDVTCKDIYGCVQISNKSTVIVDPLPSKPVITKVGMVLSTTTSYTTYQWYRNGKIIPGATSRSYTITFDGNYSVVVTNSAGCVNTSDVMSLQNLAIQNVSGNNINVAIYPNPTQSIVNIDAPVAVNVTVQDALGKKVFELNNAKQVDMSNFADGMYIFTITNQEGIIVKMDKVVKRTN